MSFSRVSIGMVHMQKGFIKIHFGAFECAIRIPIGTFSAEIPSAGQDNTRMFLDGTLASAMSIGKPKTFQRLK